MLNLKIRKRQASPAGLRLSRQSARFEDLLRRTDKDALSPPPLSLPSMTIDSPLVCVFYHTNDCTLALDKRV